MHYALYIINYTHIIYIHTCVYIYIYTYIHIYTHTYIYIYIYICICVYMYIYIYIYLYTYIYIYIYIYTHVCMYVYLSLSLSIYIYIYMYDIMYTCFRVSKTFCKDSAGAAAGSAGKISEKWCKFTSSGTFSSDFPELGLELSFTCLV